MPTIKCKSRANYEIPCEVCGETPTVDLIPEDGGEDEIEHTCLCGSCCFLDADCADPEEWVSE